VGVARSTPGKCYRLDMVVRSGTFRQSSALPLAIAAWAIAALMASSATWAQAEAPKPERIEEVIVSAPEPRYVAPTTRDRIGRIWAPVLINGRGPYRLVLDTGATHSAVIQRVVDDAGLPVRAKPVRLRGVTGSAIVPAVKADTIEFGELVIENATLPIVADAFGGADGVLGGEGMKDKRIHIEFLKDRISIVRSHGAPAPADFSTVPFKYGVSRGMRIEVRVGPIRATALIDSGAQVTVGNLALRAALARRRGEHDQYDDAIIGVTEDIQEAARVRIPSIVAGDLLVKNAEIMFSNLDIFEHWQLVSKPALIIGMDVLGVLDTLVIDYRRHELQIKVRR
jgi:predicted aspartyl protease